MYRDAHAANEAYGCVVESVGKEGHSNKSKGKITLTSPEINVNTIDAPSIFSYINNLPYR